MSEVLWASNHQPVDAQIHNREITSSLLCLKLLGTDACAASFRIPKQRQSFAQVLAEQPVLEIAQEKISHFSACSEVTPILVR